ncbi:MAG: hypothetical protein M3198_20365, partial [Actinomycetota bacterium]|nr:hypothetical protein [Actinomycetota bacterium]
MNRSRGPLHLLAFVVLFGALAGVVLLAVPASSDPVRRQIKEARRDLVEFERELESLVASFEKLQEEQEVQERRIRSLRRALRRIDGADSIDEVFLGRLVRPLVADELESAVGRKELVEALLPPLRKEIWDRGAQREDKIQTLDAAIELLESTKSGELVTKSGIDGGQLITYSADWAAVA